MSSRHNGRKARENVQKNASPKVVRRIASQIARMSDADAYAPAHTSGVTVNRIGASELAQADALRVKMLAAFNRDDWKAAQQAAEDIANVYFAVGSYESDRMRYALHTLATDMYFGGHLAQIERKTGVQA